ncbi:MAG: AAA family ATPase [Clostridia bacterium]|nr:AAA family ATPase [Clostridia bacterium]
MPAFIVRVSLAYDLVLEYSEAPGEPLKVFLKVLQQSNTAEQLFLRFTYGVYRIEAEDETRCREVVAEAWNAAFPDNSDDIMLMLVPDTGDDAAKLMTSVYQGYYGADNYQLLATELAHMIPLLKERGAIMALRKQNYLFSIDSGCGFTTLLSSFGDFTKRMNIYDDDEGKRTKYAEYKVAAETGNGYSDPYDVVKDLRESLKDNVYNIIGIDISYFLGDGKTDELRVFITDLYDLQDDYVFIFRVPFLEKKALDGLAAILSDVSSLRTVQIPPLHDAVLLEFFYDEVRRYGYKTDDSLAETLFERVRAEKRDGRFYGFKTVEKIAQEMVLRKAAHDSEEEINGNTIDHEVISPDDMAGMFDIVKTEKNGYDELSELIGMEKIAERVREIVSQVKLSMTNEKLDRPCIHMRFLGSPGTGKTTVARIIGRIFREEGILRKGAFMEYTARSLCAEYVGQTAARTAAICRDSYGSVLFIDEAYALYESDTQTNDYGKEALTTLISEMENHRDDMLVIMAGYTDDMETLMKGNAGLRSRMPYVLTFENYTRKELFDIFMLMVRKHFDYTPELESEAKRYFDTLSDEYLKSREFANARFVRNLYERTWSKGALRAALAGQTRIELCRDDFIAASGEKEFGEKLEQKKRIGF